MDYKGLSIIFTLFLFLSFYSFPTNAENVQVLVYRQQTDCPTCSDATQALRYYHELQSAITKIGIRKIQMISLSTEDLNVLYEKLNVPPSMQGNILVSVEEKFLFINYVPVEIIIDFLENHVNNYEKLVIYKEPLQNSYKILDENGDIKDCVMDTSIIECRDKSNNYFIFGIILGCLIIFAIILIKWRHYKSR